MTFAELPVGAEFVFVTLHTESALFRKESPTAYSRVADCVVPGVGVTARAGETHTTQDVNAPVQAVLTLVKGTAIRDALTGHEETLPEDITVSATLRPPFGTWLFLYKGQPYEAVREDATAGQ